MLSRKFASLALVAVVALTACGIGKNTGQGTAVPTCTQRKTIGIDKIPSGVTANQVEREDVLKPMDPAECDESVEFTETGFRCSSFVSSYAISPVDGGNGFSNNPVKVGVFADRLRIAWDAVAGHALIINGNRLAYLDGVGLDTKGKTVPTSTVVYFGDWGNVVSLDVCGWKP